MTDDASRKASPLTEQLGLVERLHAMAAGWLCEGLPDADTLRETAEYLMAAPSPASWMAMKAENERLRTVVSTANSRCDHLGMRLGEVIRERDRLRELLRLVADEPNIDKARALADAELHGPNVAYATRA